MMLKQPGHSQYFTLVMVLQTLHISWFVFHMFARCLYRRHRLLKRESATVEGGPCIPSIPFAKALSKWRILDQELSNFKWRFTEMRVSLNHPF